MGLKNTLATIMGLAIGISIPASALYYRINEDNELEKKSLWKVTEISGKEGGVVRRFVDYYGFDNDQDGLTDKVIGKSMFLGFRTAAPHQINYDIESPHIKELMKEYNLK